MVAYRETRLWSDEPHFDKSDEIDIRFIIEYEDVERRLVRSVNPEIFRQSKPAEIFHAPALTLNQDVTYRHSFTDGTTVKGRLHWVTMLHVTQGQQIIGRVELERVREPTNWTYEGFMIDFGTAKPTPSPTPAPPQPEPIIPIPAPNEAEAIIVVEAVLETTELFPFVYIKPWPKLALHLITEGFMTVPSEVMDTTLYQNLKKSTGPQKREEAVTFIDDTLCQTENGIYKGQFQPPFQPLAQPFAALLEFPPHLRHDCSMTGLTHWVETAFGSWADLVAAIGSTEGQETLVNIWNSVIALMITTGYDRAWLSSLIHLLQVTHLISLARPQDSKGTGKCDMPAYTSAQLTRMVHAIWILPDDIFPVYPPSEQAKPPAIRPYAVGSIQTVHYKPDRYVFGDVQRIEIVTQGETRQEVHRRLTQAEILDQEHRGTQNSSLRTYDTTTTDLVNQVQKTLSQRMSATTVKNYQTDYGLPNTNSMQVTGNWWVEDQPAGGYIKDSSKFARDVIDRSVKAIRNDAVKRRKLRVHEESEVTETRTLANVGANGDRQTVYRWVNRDYHMEIKTSDDRLVFEIFLDVPSRQLLQAASKLCQVNVAPPISPDQLGVKTYKNLSPEERSTPSPSGSVYYLDVFDHYDIAPDDCAPPPTRIVSVGLTSKTPVCETCLDIPTGYLAMNATATVTSFSKAPQIQVVIGGISLSAQDGTPQTFKGDFTAASGRHVNQLWASVLCVSPPTTSPSETTHSGDVAETKQGTSAQQTPSEFEGYFAFTVQVQCLRSQATLAKWQMETYQKIQSSYQLALTRYHAALKEQQQILQSRPPNLLREIVQEQIIQCAISDFTETSLARPSDGSEEASDCNSIPRYTQFLKNAFDWEGMAIELFEETDNSFPLNDGQSGLLSLFSSSFYFLEFLQAKRARLLLSVKPDYARSILLAWRTGVIWPCEDDITPCMSGDLNIVELLLEQRKAPPNHPSDQWTITLPTEMIALSRQDPFGHQGESDVSSTL